MAEDAAGLDVQQATEDADAAINTVASVVTLIKKARFPSDSDKPWRGSQGEADLEVEVKGAFMSLTSESEITYKIEQEKKTMVKRQREKFVVSGIEIPTNSNIEEFDLLYDSDKEDVWNIQRVTVLRAGHQIITAELFLTR